MIYPTNLQGVTMRKLRIVFSILPLLLLFLSLTRIEAASLIRPLNFSLWSEYKNNSFEGLSQEEKTKKLQEIFQNQLEFVEVHGIRRLIIKILNPSAFVFFHPNHFDSTKDDNFYYWANLLSQHSELEALFDKNTFKIEDTYQEILSSYWETFYNKVMNTQSSLGEFKNLYEKLTWFSSINDLFDSSFNKGALLRGITFDPNGVGPVDPIYQNLLNLLDQYKYNTNEKFPKNNFNDLRRAIILPIDEKDFAFANLSRFPLLTDLRGDQSESIGISPPSTFPSLAPEYLPPVWRSTINQPLLENVYLKLYDKRLIHTLYQNLEILKDPTIVDVESVNALSSGLAKSCKGLPFIKGPGKITNLKGTTTVTGMFTYFKTAGGVCEVGKFTDGQWIEVRPSGSAPIQKIVNGTPLSNKEMKLVSCFSTTADIIDAEYYYSPIPINWSTPKISNALKSNIYYVLNTDFKAPGEKYMGNWHIDNFIHFVFNPSYNKGWLLEKIFTSFEGNGMKPSNNMVIYDYSMIPNGTVCSECNWELGN